MKNGFTTVELMLFIAIVALLLFPCLIFSLFNEQSNKKAELQLERSDIVKVVDAPAVTNRIVVFDGCEYIESANVLDSLKTIYTLCHKGNCTNCFKRMYRLTVFHEQKQ